MSNLPVAVVSAGTGNWGTMAGGNCDPGPSSFGRPLTLRGPSPLPSTVASINLTTPEQQRCPTILTSSPKLLLSKRNGSARDTDCSGCCSAHHPGAHISNTIDYRDTSSRDVSDPGGTTTKKVPGRGGGGETVRALKYRQGNICAIVPPTEEEKKGL